MPTLSGMNVANLSIVGANYITLDGWLISNATSAGIEINDDQGAVTNIEIRHSSIVNNAKGINVDSVSTILIQNNVIANNSAAGVQIGQTAASIYHNVFASNGVGLEIVGTTTGTQVYNNIFLANTSALTYDTATVAASDYNDFSGNAETLAQLQGAFGLEANSLEVDPEFVDPLAVDPDFHLQPTSALIDAGYDLGAAVTEDQDEETRPYGAGFDIGLDERQVVP